MLLQISLFNDVSSNCLMQPLMNYGNNDSSSSAGWWLIEFIAMMMCARVVVVGSCCCRCWLSGTPRLNSHR